MEVKMLDELQNKFPLIFTENQDYLNNLTKSEQLSLSEILEKLDDTKLLNNSLVSIIFFKPQENIFFR